VSPAGGPGYDAHATARWASEPGKEDRPAERRRGPFVRDRARVMHSSALRRLAAKTQVVEVGAGDFPRTRLTHSLECAQIGREFGTALGCDPDLVDAACLAHDLGHPPFGHNGEMALAGLAAGCGGFEGNAQSLRLLTRLEAKVAGAGLNLTRATLDATIKYPWGAPAVAAAPAAPAAGPEARLAPVGGHARAPALQASDAGPAKFGYYADDEEAYLWIKQGAPEGQLCLEAQVMDWADDVAYSVHGLEDGLHAGHITVGALHGTAERAAVIELAGTRYLVPGTVTPAELEEVFDGLLGLPYWPANFDGGPASLAALKLLTSELIGRFCGSAQEATLAAAGPPPLTRYAAALVVPRRQRLECALLKAVTALFVMSREGVAARQAVERELIGELAAAVADGAPGTLDRALRPAYLAAGSHAARLRVVVDQIASLTDTSAIAWHDRLCQDRRPPPRDRPAGAVPAAAAVRREGTSDAR
jgi:dGTPase